MLTIFSPPCCPKPLCVIPPCPLKLYYLFQHRNNQKHQYSIIMMSTSRWFIFGIVPSQVRVVTQAKVFEVMPVRSCLHPTNWFVELNTINQSINRSINMVIRWWFALFGNVEYWERGSQLVTLWWFYSSCHHHVITTQKHLKQLWCFQA